MKVEADQQVSIIVNGRRFQRSIPERTLLIDFLRDELHLHGSRIGCDEGICGACSVDLDGQLVKSCMVLAAQADGSCVTTIEDLARDGELDAIQKAFVTCGAQQCGYCTSGMIMAARDLLKRNPRPTEEEIRYALSGNLCRCTGYAPIIAAIMVASGQVDRSSAVHAKNESGWVGRSISRHEDRRLVSGAGRYTDNVADAGALYCAILRSTKPHARIRGIRTEAAAALPGVVKVITGREAAEFWNPMPPSWDPRGFGGKLPGSRPIAVDKVRFVGEPVAAVLAESRYLAEDAIALIEVEYDPLPCILTREDALGEAGRAPRALLYDEWTDNRQLFWPDKVGDVDGAFAKAHLVIDDEFSSQRYSTMPLETRAVHAKFDVADRTLTVHLSSQAPHSARALLAHVLGLSESKIRVIAGDVGGGFGGKLAVDPEYIPALLSVITGRPVKWMESRAEWLIAGPHARDFRMKVAAAFAVDGTLLALKTDIDADMGCDGAERAGGVGMPCMGGIYAPGGYKVDNYEMNVLAFVTNKAPYGPCRGYGKDIANMAIERMMDLAADRLGIDRFAIRRKNLTDHYPHHIVTGPIIESAACLRVSIGLSK